MQPHLDDEAERDAGLGLLQAGCAVVPPQVLHPPHAALPCRQLQRLLPHAACPPREAAQALCHLLPCVDFEKIQEAMAIAFVYYFVYCERMHQRPRRLPPQIAEF